MTSFFHKKYITFCINVFVGLFFTTVLIFKKGYSYVPITLGAVSVIYVIIYFIKLKTYDELSKIDKIFIFSLLYYFISFLLSVFINLDSFREIDNPSRVLLFIPLFILFRHFPLKIDTILYAIPTGAIITGCVALFQKFYLGYDKPFPEIMHIQVGDIAISLATFSLVITIHFFIKQYYKSVLIGLAGVILAMSTSALSGARGGWVGFPIILIILLLLYRQFLSKKLIITFFAIMGGAFILLVMNPKFNMTKRYYAAESDIKLYLEKNDKSTSLGARFDMWENAFVAIKESPIFGHGSRGYELFRNKQIESGSMAKTTLQFNSLHNQFLESWVKQGLLGFIGLIVILFVPFIYFMKNCQQQNLEIKCVAILGVMHLLSHLFYFMSQSFLAHNSGSLFYFFVCIIFYSLIRSSRSSSY